jgi:hypothetical protein
MAPVSLAAALLVLSLAGAHARAAELACAQEPGKRLFWLERAYCDLPMNGPERAHGIVLWNHGILGTTESWRGPAPLAFRLLQARGWDVVMLKRHHSADADNVVHRTVQRTLEEVTAARRQGYRRVVLSGQSFGGHVTLEALDFGADIDGAIAFAPGVRAMGASGRVDVGGTDRILKTAKVGRLALLFPRDDDLVDRAVRGESARAILSRRALPYLLLDETSGIVGHLAAGTGRFALRHGLCLVEFLTAPGLAPGRFTCPPVSDEWPIVRELLLPRADKPPTLATATTLPAAVSSLAGLRWALLADALVLVAPVEGPGGRLRLMYRATSFTVGGGVVDAAVGDGVIRAVLENRSTVTLTPKGEGAISWRSADGSRSLDAPLVRGRPEP